MLTVEFVQKSDEVLKASPQPINRPRDIHGEMAGR